MTSRKAVERKPVPEAVPYQRTALPVPVMETYPAATGTLNLERIGRGGNGKDYAIKTRGDHNSNGYIPATEWFCYELAQHLLIPTPGYDILVMPDGERVFGSVWEGGVMPMADTANLLGVLRGAIHVPHLIPFLSKVYALDLFINNMDRHFGNYLLRNGYQGHVMLAYDFSQAWYAVGEPWGSVAQDARCNTQGCHTAIIQTGNFDAGIAAMTLDEIAAISAGRIESILSQMPEEWMEPGDHQDIASWWQSGARIDRINRLKRDMR